MEIKSHIADVKSFNGLTPKEWALLSRSVWRDIKTPPRSKHRIEHGATFPLDLAERVIKIYSNVGHNVLDPFLGTGTTLVAAKKLGRNGYGFELYKKFYKIAVEQLQQEIIPITEQVSEIKVFNDDCRNLCEYIKPETIHLTLTSPPYANFIYRSVENRNKRHKNSILIKANRSKVKPYGDDTRDFGNLEYNEYINEVKQLMKQIFKVTVDGGYNIWVIRDYRLPENGKPYLPVHIDIAKAGEEAGFVWLDLIVWDQNENRKLLVLGYPSVFYTNINHSFLIVLRKPMGNKNKIDNEKNTENSNK